MARGAPHFRQTDLTRALKGARAAGIEVARVEIGPDGKIVIWPGQDAVEPVTDFDRWKAKRDAG